MATEITLQGTLVNTEKGAEGGRIAYAKQIYDDIANVDIASVNRVLGVDSDWKEENFKDVALGGESILSKLRSIGWAVGNGEDELFHEQIHAIGVTDIVGAITHLLQNQNESGSNEAEIFTPLKEGEDLNNMDVDLIWIDSVYDGLRFYLNTTYYQSVLFTKQARKVEYGGNTLLVVEQLAYVYDINDGNAFKGLFFRVNRQNGNDKTYGQWVRIDNQGANAYTDNLIGDLNIDLHENLRGDEVIDVVTALNKLDDKKFADIYQHANKQTSLSDVTQKLYGNEKNELDNALNVFGDNKHVFGILNEEKNSVETFFNDNFSEETNRTIGDALQKLKDSIPTSTGGEGGSSASNINIVQSIPYTTETETEALSNVVSQKAIADALATKADVSALNDLEMIQVTDSNNFAVVDEQGNAILSVENGFVKTKDFDSEIYAEKQRMMIEAMSYHGKWVFWTCGDVSFDGVVKQAGKHVFVNCPTINEADRVNITKVIMGNGAVKPLGSLSSTTVMQCTEVNTYGFNGMGSTSFSILFASMPIKRLYLNHWDTSNVNSMYAMFRNCTSLQSLDLSSFDTTNVTTMQFMFYGCTPLTSLDLSNFDTAKVINMQFMFQGCTSLQSLDLSNFDTTNVTAMQHMFYNCTSLTSLDLSSFDTTNVTTMQSMFYNCTSLTSLDLSNFDTSSVTTMYAMFQGCTSLQSLDLSNFDTTNVTAMQHMFYNCTSLTSLDLSSFDTTNVTTMQSMFYNCTSLTSLDLSNFDTTKVTNMQIMFNGCRNITSFKVSENFFKANLEEFDLRQLRGWTNEQEVVDLVRALPEKSTATRLILPNTIQIGSTIGGVCTEAEQRGWTITQG